MSEAERKRRLDYRRVRKKWITRQALLLAVVLVITLLSAIFCTQLGKERYINYQETSVVDSGVYLKENDFYEEDYLGSDYSYVASLIDKVNASFTYQIQLDSQNPVDITYTYGVNAVLEIINSKSGKTLYAPVYEILPDTQHTVHDKEVFIRQTICLDYDEYNDLANRFIVKYKLDGVEARIHLKMHVQVVGTSEEFDGQRTDRDAVASIQIPLTQKMVDVKITPSAIDAENRILAYTNGVAVMIFRVIAIVGGIFSVLMAVMLVALIYLTRNTDITYDLRVSGLVKSYRSYIQKINNVFDTTGYQLLEVDTFNEMLEIRDTIQSPILMNENEDRTATKFLIPTNTKLLYVYEIRVEDYDEIYRTPTEPTSGVEEEPSAAESTEDAVEALSEAVVEEVAVGETVEEVVEEIPEETPEINVAETMAAIEEVDVQDILAEMDEGVDEEISPYSGIRRSFAAKLAQSTEARKSFYSEIKNELLSYRSVKSRLSWAQETFKKGHTHLARMNIRGKTLCLYLALDPMEYADTKYFYSNVGDKAQYEAVPMMVKIKSPRGVKYAKELIEGVATRFELVKNPDYEAVDYAPEFKTTAELIDLGLIKDPRSEYARKAEEREDVLLLETVHREALDEALASEDPVLEQIDYIDESPLPISEEVEAVEVVDVVWKQKEYGNTLSQYDPNGAQVTEGDVVLVPTEDETDGHEVLRKAAVAHGNHKVEAQKVNTPLKKIIGVLRQKVQSALMRML